MKKIAFIFVLALLALLASSCEDSRLISTYVGEVKTVEYNEDAGETYTTIYFTNNLPPLTSTGHIYLIKGEMYLIRFLHETDIADNPEQIVEIVEAYERWGR